MQKKQIIKKSLIQSDIEETDLIKVSADKTVVLYLYYRTK